MATQPDTSNFTPDDWMRLAIGLAEKCIPNETAYSVGCVIVDENNCLVATGYSREDGGRGHAEQIALDKSTGGVVLYATMEPCSKRGSDPVSCAQRIIKRGTIKRVFVAVAEPPNFQNCEGTKQLREAGIDVIYMRHFAAQAHQPNRHILRNATP